MAKERRPFHETIVDAIREAIIYEMRGLGKLVVETKIPKNHDEITLAWRRRLKDLDWSEKDDRVLAAINEQKQEAEAEAAVKQVEEQKRVTIFASKVDWRLLQEGSLKELPVFKETDLHYQFGDNPSEDVVELVIRPKKER